MYTSVRGVVSRGEDYMAAHDKDIYVYKGLLCKWEMRQIYFLSPLLETEVAQKIRIENSRLGLSGV